MQTPGTEPAVEDDKPGKPFSTGLFIVGVAAIVIGWVVSSNHDTNFYTYVGLGAAFQLWIAAAIVRPIEKIYILLLERLNERS